MLPAGHTRLLRQALNPGHAHKPSSVGRSLSEQLVFGATWHVCKQQLVPTLALSFHMASNNSDKQQ